MRAAIRNLLFRFFRWNETKVHELNYLFWEERIIFGDVQIPIGDSYKQSFLDHINTRLL